jgi:hypothetical protein
MQKCTAEKPCGKCDACLDLAEAETEFVRVDPEAMKKQVAAALEASKKAAAQAKKSDGAARGLAGRGSLHLHSLVTL